MLFYFSFLLFFAGILLALNRRRSVFFTLLSTAMLFGSYLLMYVGSTARLSQDRGNYYSMYLKYDWPWLMRHVMRVPHLGMVQDDLLSVWLLRLFPGGLGMTEFSVVFISGFLLAVLVFLGLAVYRGQIALGAAPLVLVAMFSDRLFMDMAFNVTQSSFSGLVFLAGIVGFGWPGVLLLSFVALGLHGRMFILAAFAFVMSFASRLHRSLLPLVLLAAAFVFVARIVHPYPLTDLLAHFGVMLRGSEAGFDPNQNASFFDGISRSFALSPSMLVQIALSIILPAGLAGFGGFSPSGASTVECVGKSRQMMLSYALASGAVVLLLFPEIALAQRLVVVPVVLFPLLLSEERLWWLATIKALFFFVSTVAGMIGSQV